jgi:anti-anti-sigma factor
MSLDMCAVRRAGHQAVITLPAEIDMDNADQVRDELLRALNGGPAVLVVDMTGTVYCAAAGARALIRAGRRAAAAGAGLRVAVSAPIVRRVLELTGTGLLLDICPGLDAALAGLPGTRGMTVVRYRPGGGRQGAGQPAAGLPPAAAGLLVEGGRLGRLAADAGDDVAGDVTELDVAVL